MKQIGKIIFALSALNLFMAIGNVYVYLHYGHHWPNLAVSMLCFTVGTFGLVVATEK